MPEFDKIIKWFSHNSTALLAITASCLLFYFTAKLILNIFLFILGLLLLNFGLRKLNIPQINIYLDNIIVKVKQFWANK